MHNYKISQQEWGPTFLSIKQKESMQIAESIFVKSLSLTREKNPIQA